MAWQEGEPQFDWEKPSKPERLKRLGNIIIYFILRPSFTFEEPDQDKPLPEIHEEDKDDWYFPEDWLDPG